VDAKDPDCSSSISCNTTGTNLFINPSFENGNWTGSETFLSGVYATPSASNAVHFWGLGGSKWVETNKATDGNRVVYVDSDEVGKEVCIAQSYTYGPSGDFNDCDIYQMCFDWASFNNNYPNGRSAESRPTIDVIFSDANNQDLRFISVPLGEATANQDWNNLVWTSISFQFQLAGNFQPPPNTAKVTILISEASGKNNSFLIDDTNLSVVGNCNDIDICGNPTAAAQQFNFFIEEDMTSRNGDIEGAGAIGGNLTLDGSNTVASNRTGSFQVSGDSRPTGLLIGGRIYYTNGSGINVNQNTYVKLGNTAGSTIHDTQNNTNSLTRITNGGYDNNPTISLQTHQPANSVGQSNLINFTSIFNEFRTMSDVLANKSSNNSIQVNGQQGYINMQTNATNVINVSGTTLNAIQGLIFNGSQPSASNPVIINIDASGTFNWQVPSFNGVGDTQGQFIILNFYNSTIVNLTGGSTIIGTVFAPRAHVDKNTSGNVNGQLIAKSYIHRSGELHHHPFSVTFDGDCDNNTPGGSLDPEVCYIIADGQGSGGQVPDTFFTVNPTTGITSLVGPTGTMNSEALAFIRLPKILLEQLMF